MRFRTLWLTALAACALIPAVRSIAAVKSGPEIGSPMPQFELRDQNGQTHTLRSLLGPKGAVLVFYRSADW